MSIPMSFTNIERSPRHISSLKPIQGQYLENHRVCQLTELIARTGCHV